MGKKQDTPMNENQRAASERNWKLLRLRSACDALRQINPEDKTVIDLFEAKAIAKLGYVVLLYAKPGQYPFRKDPLFGEVYGHPKYPAAAEVWTSSVQKVIRNRSGNFRVKTENTEYYILHPHSDFYEWAENFAGHSAEAKAP